MTIRRIHTREEFVAFAAELGVRLDWHEPDEQNITARIEGTSFDNAGFYPASAHPNLDPIAQELHVVISRTEWTDPRASAPEVVADIAVINLANLCAWASA